MCSRHVSDFLCPRRDVQEDRWTDVCKHASRSSPFICCSCVEATRPLAELRVGEGSYYRLLLLSLH